MFLSLLIWIFAGCFVVCSVVGGGYFITSKVQVERTKRLLITETTQRQGMENAYLIEQEKLAIMKEQSSQTALPAASSDRWSLQ